MYRLLSEIRKSLPFCPASSWKVLIRLSCMAMAWASRVWCMIQKLMPITTRVVAAMSTPPVREIFSAIFMTAFPRGSRRELTSSSGGGGAS